MKDQPLGQLEMNDRFCLDFDILIPGQPGCRSSCAAADQAADQQTRSARSEAANQHAKARSTANHSG